MYKVNTSPTIDKIFYKLSKKNPKQLKIISKKIEEILENPQHYKNLRKPLQYLKAVHIDKHFVLTFSVDENKKTVTLEDYDLHDKIYNK
ncbi:MAG: hypothetical protein KKG75_01060 [Nanoarchaeota archaeon]|nr:hypothetical protein [Nanoarchaeota archaeon]